MFVTKDETKIKWLGLDRKLHAIEVSSKNESINLKKLYDNAINIVKEKEEMCKKIYYLGISITGSEEAGWGFLTGWLLRSIKKDQAWAIDHSSEDLSEDELTEHLASLMEESAKMLREKRGKLKLSTPVMGGNDGTDLFK